MKKRTDSSLSAAAWLCVLSLGGAIVGCDRDPAPGAREGEFAGGAGDSALAGRGGDHEMTAGTGGAGGRGAAGGSENQPSSACRAEPELTPSFPAATALDPDLVARAAVVIGSCMPDDGVARNATHLWLSHLAAPRAYYRFVDQLSCLANADCGCAAVEHCLGWSYRQAPTDCPITCKNDVFSGCDEDIQLSVDCARLGMHCDYQEICVAEAPAACQGSARSCSAQGEVTYCDNGALRKTPCEALGFSCVAGECVGGGASCGDGVGDTYELALPIGTGCAGTTLRACLGGQSTDIDCATRGPGFSCQSRDGSFFCGLAAECVPANNYSAADSTAATCDGTTLSFCNAGRLEHLDCTAFGFTGCDLDRSVNHYGCTPALQLSTD